MQTHINKKAVQASFSRAATYYDQFADLQREIGHHLMTLIPLELHKAKSILDLGCGTGYFSTQLNERYLDQGAQLTCFDLSPDMLVQAKQKNGSNCYYIEGDIDALPFSSRQFDLIFSNLVLQWSEQLAGSLKQTKKILNKNGYLCFSTLLDGTLIELQEAWKSVDNNVHINPFLTQEQVEKGLQQAGFKNCTIKTETRVKKYTDVVSVMKALKGIGANHVTGGNKIRVTGRKLLQQLELAYQPFRDKEGFYNLTYQVCYVVVAQEHLTLNK